MIIFKSVIKIRRILPAAMWDQTEEGQGQGPGRRLLQSPPCGGLSRAGVGEVA